MSIEKPEEQKIIKIEGEIFETDKNGFVDFGDISNSLLDEQSQYASRYVDGAFGEYPKLGEGLRFEGDPRELHELKIHKDDILEFVKRYKKYMTK